MPSIKTEPGRPIRQTTLSNNPNRHIPKKNLRRIVPLLPRDLQLHRPDYRAGDTLLNFPIEVLGDTLQPRRRPKIQCNVRAALPSHHWCGAPRVRRAQNHRAGTARFATARRSHPTSPSDHPVLRLRGANVVHASQRTSGRLPLYHRGRARHTARLARGNPKKRGRGASSPALCAPRPDASAETQHRPSPQPAAGQRCRAEKRNRRRDPSLTPATTRRHTRTKRLDSARVQPFCFAHRHHSGAVAADDCAASAKKTPTCGEHNDRTHQKNGVPPQVGRVGLASAGGEAEHPAGALVGPEHLEPHLHQIVARKRGVQPARPAA